jgi:hypothetical protein
MSNKTTIVLSMPDNTIARFLFDDYVSACHDAGIVVRYEPYTLDVYKELNDKALEVERNQALIELEEEILHNKACVGGSCED